MPNGVLFGSTNAATKLRELLLSECDLQAVISLPSGVFKPYSGVGTAALIFEKRRKPLTPTLSPSAGAREKTGGSVGSKLEARSDSLSPRRGEGQGEGCADSLSPADGERAGVRGSVWFYDLTADGFSLDDKRTPIDANDIPDVLAKWPNREEGPNSYRVPIEKIRENDWSLAAGRYKPVTTEAVNHDSPKDILAEVVTIENSIAARAKKLLSSLP